MKINKTLQDLVQQWDSIEVEQKNARPEFEKLVDQTIKLLDCPKLIQQSIDHDAKRIKTVRLVQNLKEQFEDKATIFLSHHKGKQDDTEPSAKKAKLNHIEPKLNEIYTKIEDYLGKFRTKITDLPDEILIKIVKLSGKTYSERVTTCNGISREFNKVCQDSSLFADDVIAAKKIIDEFFQSETLTNEIIKKLSAYRFDQKALENVTTYVIQTAKKTQNKRDPEQEYALFDAQYLLIPFFQIFSGQITNFEAFFKNTGLLDFSLILPTGRKEEDLHYDDFALLGFILEHADADISLLTDKLKDMNRFMHLLLKCACNYGYASYIKWAINGYTERSDFDKSPESVTEYFSRIFRYLKRAISFKQLEIVKILVQEYTKASSYSFTNCEANLKKLLNYAMDQQVSDNSNIEILECLFSRYLVVAKQQLIDQTKNHVS